MVNLQISDQTYRTLKGFVVDPFDDTPDTVLTRLMDIVQKAQQKWSTFDKALEADQSATSRKDRSESARNEDPRNAEVLL